MQEIPSMGIASCFVRCIAPQYLPTTWFQIAHLSIHESPESADPTLHVAGSDREDRACCIAGGDVNELGRDGGTVAFGALGGDVGGAILTGGYSGDGGDEDAVD